MKHPGLLFLFFSATLCQLSAVEIPPGGSDVRGEAALQAYSSLRLERWSRSRLGNASPSHRPDAAKAYAAQFTAPISAEIEKNERVLAIIKARVVGSGESGEVLAKLQLRGAPYTAFGDTIGVGIHREWTEQPVVFIVDDVVPADKAAVVLLCGQKEQSIEVESIRVLKYPATTDVSGFPRAKLIKRSYAGREPDAPWRKAALERIEQHRKADLSMIVKGEDGKPLAETEVKLSLRRHAFGFGSAVVAKRFSGESEDTDATARSWTSSSASWFSRMT
jgi:endo-1,4-beta-xylanase